MGNGLPKFISGVKPGDKVMTRDGSQGSVLDVFKYEVDEELIEIETDDGRIVRCTKDHRWLVRRPTGEMEMVEAKNLQDGDELVDVV
jgi:intein/homing endonuclease